MNLTSDEKELVAEVLSKSKDLAPLHEKLEDIINKTEHYFLAKAAYNYAALHELKDSGVPLIEAQKLKKAKLKQELLKAIISFKSA